MIKIEFTKMNGAGNDFVMINGRGDFTHSLSTDEINRICDRRRGVGADGLIIISPSIEADFEMKYYNADGRLGSLCGNGARSAIKFAKMNGYYPGKTTRFIVNGISYTGEYISDSCMRFFAGKPGLVKLDFKIKVAGQLIHSHFANTGSPHIVIEIKDVLANPRLPDSGYEEMASFPVFDLGKEIRYHNDFAPGGANVNFIKRTEDGFQIRTYERGVEDETLACGTGSLAAALIVMKKYNLPSPLHVKTWGGDILTAEYEENQNGYEGLILSGPADVNFTGIFELNNNTKPEK